MEQAVLFADVAESTKLYEMIGDSEAKRLVDACLGLLRAVTADFGGRVIKTIGDELMCAFPSADAVALAACEMQNRLADDESAGKYGLSVRIGFHAGPLIEDQGDVFGDAVNTAARIADLAKGGQIMTTESVVNMMSPELRDSTRNMGSFVVKGKADSIVVCEVVWQAENLTMITGRLSFLNPTPASLLLLFPGGSLTLSPDDPPLTIGRDRRCSVRLSVPCASRTHARIEFRRDKFVLTDTSTNGTYVQAAADNEVVLKREDFILWGVGRISLGHSIAEGGADLTWQIRS